MVYVENLWKTSNFFKNITQHCNNGILTQYDHFLFRLFQPVQYGTKPEGRLAAFANVVGQRPPTSSSATSTSSSTTSQSGQTRGKSPVTTAATTPISHGETSGTIFGKGQGV